MINWLIAAALGGSVPLIVTINGANQSRTQTTNSPLVGRRYDNVGDEFIVGSGNWPSTTPSFSQVGAGVSWLNKSKAASNNTYSIRCTENSTSGTWSWSSAADSRGVWLNLDTTRAFFGAFSGGGLGFGEANITIEISDDGGSTILDSATGVLRSEVTI